MTQKEVIKKAFDSDLEILKKAYEGDKYLMNILKDIIDRNASAIWAVLIEKGIVTRKECEKYVQEALGKEK